MSDSIFSVKAGDRVTIESQVSICFPELKAKGVLAVKTRFAATATDQFSEMSGVRRRLFVDTSIAFAGHHQIWMANTPSSNEAEDEWQEYFE